MEHHFETKVYHHDTDCYGIVWHGNYFKFCEQARYDIVEKFSKGMKYFEENNILTLIVEANIKYKIAAKVHDILDIRTTIKKITPLRATLLQEITNQNTGVSIADVEVTFVCTDKDGKLYRKLPDEMYELLKKMEK